MWTNNFHLLPLAPFVPLKSQWWIYPLYPLASVYGRTMEAPHFFNSQSGIPEPSPSWQWLSWWGGTSSKWKGRGPKRQGGPWLVALGSLAFFRVQTKQQPWRSWHALVSRSATTLLLFFPFGTLIMSCCDAADWQMSGCSRPVTGPALLRALRHYAAPCLVSPLFLNCWSPPVRASETSCCPAYSPSGPASLFCLYSWLALNCARCQRKQHGTLCALCFESWCCGSAGCCCCCCGFCCCVHHRRPRRRCSCCCRHCGPWMTTAPLHRLPSPLSISCFPSPFLLL